MPYGYLAIDAYKEGNELRFVNHSSIHANVQYRWVIVNNQWHVVYQAIRRIAKNEQLLVDYGAEYWVSRKNSNIEEDENSILQHRFHRMPDAMQKFIERNA